MSDFMVDKDLQTKSSRLLRFVFHTLWGLSILLFAGYLFAVAAYPALLIIALLQVYWSLRCAKLFSYRSEWKTVQQLAIGIGVLGGSTYFIISFSL